MVQARLLPLVLIRLGDPTISESAYASFVEIIEVAESPCVGARLGISKGAVEIEILVLVQRRRR
jgi:hypothetical protein